MKAGNNRKLLILSALVIIVWGIIIVKVRDVIKPSEVKSDSINGDQEQFVDRVPEITNEILADYEDPFLRTQASKPVGNVVPKGGNKSKKSEKKPELPWPTIRYLGPIKGSDSDKRFAMVSINQKEKFVKTGQVVDGVTIGKIFVDSIFVSYQGATKMVLK